MTAQEQNSNPPEVHTADERRSLTNTGVWVSAVAVIVLLVAGAAVARLLIATRTEADRKPGSPRITLVEVIPAQTGIHQVQVEAMGTVRPAREAVLNPRVSGQVVGTGPGFIPGGHISSGDMLVQIDPTDYHLAVKQRQSDLARAQSELQLEEGRQAVARQDLALLNATGTVQDESLILRVPQYTAAQAAVASAQAALDRAELDVQRTTVRASFNAIVRSQDTDRGELVSSASRLGVLIGTDRYYVEVLVPVDELPWIQIPSLNHGEGASVTIQYEAGWGPGKTRQGNVIQLLPTLEQQGRMARVLVAVDDPLALTEENSGKPALIDGALVRAVIAGIHLENIFTLPASAVHDGNIIRLATEKDTLELRPVVIIRRTRTEVIVKDGIKPGDKIIVSELSTPVLGMSLRYTDDSQPKETLR